MEGMGGKGKQSPWGHLDEVEDRLKKEDPTEFARVRLQERLRTRKEQAKPRGEEVNLIHQLHKSIDPDPALMERYHEIVGPKVDIAFCEALLSRPDLTMRDHYKIENGKHVVRDVTERSKTQDYLALVPHYDQNPQAVSPFKVVQATEAIEKIFPEIHFEFKQTEDVIEYTATVRPIRE